VPFFGYTLLFLFLPAGQVLVGAFKGAHGTYTFANVHEVLHNHQLRNAYETSIRISLYTALLGAGFGILSAYAAIREGTPRWIRSAFTTFSGVAANFGGIPLAFAFIATLGTIGIITQFLANQLHYNLYQHGFTLFGFWGVALPYPSFRIPLIRLVIAPAMDGRGRAWSAASANLGAGRLQYWGHIGVPILMPSMLGAVILLFGNSFAAYATAYGLTSGGVNLVPIRIGNDLTGNVSTNPHEGQALAFGMFVVLAAMMLVYVPLQRRASRWAH